MRKRWVFELFTNDKPVSIFNFDWKKRYHTEKDAKQAMSDWESGRGNLAFINKKADGWFGKVYHQ